MNTHSHNGFKRLVYDIETSPYVALVWKPGYKINVGPEMIVREAAIITICWKWAHQKKIHSLTWDENQCDKKMLEEFVEILKNADEIVTHNGDRFDTPWVRTRCLLHGISIPPDFVSIDTLKLARSKFRLASNKLDYIAQFLGLGRKKPIGLQLWKDVLKKDPQALRKMVTYCKHDVKLLEAIWDRINPYVAAKTNRAREISHCPECGSSNTHVSNHRVTAAGYDRTQFQCQEDGCGKYHTVASSRFQEE